MGRQIISVLRVINGIALALGILLSAGFLISVLREAPLKPAVRTLSYLALYAGALLVQVFIATHAFRRSPRCSFRTALIAYSLWIACFIWHGWFTEWAPYRLHEVLAQSAAEPVYRRMYVSAAAWVLCYSLFPILCYMGRSERRPGDRA